MHAALAKAILDLSLFRPIPRLSLLVATRLAAFGVLDGGGGPVQALLRDGVCSSCHLLRALSSQMRTQPQSRILQRDEVSEDQAGGVPWSPMASNHGWGVVPRQAHNRA